MKLTEQIFDCLKGLEEHHNTVDGWRRNADAHPYLYNLYRRDGSIEGKDVGLEPEIWNRAPSLPLWLRGAAQLVQTKGSILIACMPPTHVGLALVVEAWMLSGTEFSELEKIAKARKIHVHPDRRECRMVLGALFLGAETYTVCHIRKHHRIEVWPDPDEEHMMSYGGDVPEGLRYLADTWLSVQAAEGAKRVRLH